MLTRLAGRPYHQRAESGYFDRSLLGATHLFGERADARPRTLLHVVVHIEKADGVVSADRCTVSERGCLTLQRG